VRVARWYMRSRVAGVVLFAVGTSLMGLGVAQAVTTPVSAVETQTQTQTLHHTRVVTHTETRVVTVHVKGHVVSRHDHVLVVYVPRIVVKTPSGHHKTVPPHIVRIREPEPPLFGVPATAAFVIGVAPPPVTVDVPVTMTETVPVDVAGPTVTSTSVSTEFVTLPQQTTTVTLPQDTTTVTAPPTS
jgi:hypothetical protein